MGAIRFYYEVVKGFEADDHFIPSIASGMPLRNLELACSKLVQTGIPRFVVQQLKKGLQNEVIQRAHMVFSED